MLRPKKKNKGNLETTIESNIVSTQTNTNNETIANIALQLDTLKDNNCADPKGFDEGALKLLKEALQLPENWYLGISMIDSLDNRVEVGKNILPEGCLNYLFTDILTIGNRQEKVEALGDWFGPIIKYSGNINAIGTPILWDGLPFRALIIATLQERDIKSFLTPENIGIIRTFIKFYDTHAVAVNNERELLKQRGELVEEPKTKKKNIMPIGDEETHHSSYFIPFGIPIPISHYEKFCNTFKEVIEEYIGPLEEILEEKNDKTTTNRTSTDISTKLYDSRGNDLTRSTKAIKAFRKFIEVGKELTRVMKKIGIEYSERSKDGAHRENISFSNSDLYAALQTEDNLTKNLDVKNVLRYFNDETDTVPRSSSEVREEGESGWYVIANTLEVLELLAIRRFARDQNLYSKEGKEEISRETTKRLSTYVSPRYMLMLRTTPNILLQGERAYDPNHAKDLLFYKSNSFQEYINILRTRDKKTTQS